MNLAHNQLLRELGPQWRSRTVAADQCLALRDQPDARTLAIAVMNWDELQQAVHNCTACSLCQTRKQTVFGSGDQQADWLLVGEAPGADEDATGKPFVGQAGHLLDNILRALELERTKNVYVANILKCRPPNNRNPLAEEVGQCRLFLHRQIDLLQPKLIVAMGRFAAQAVLHTEASIASLRSNVHQYILPAGNVIPVVVTYHPAYLLRTPEDKEKAWEDWSLARRISIG